MANDARRPDDVAAPEVEENGPGVRVGRSALRHLVDLHALHLVSDDPPLFSTLLSAWSGERQTKARTTIPCLPERLRAPVEQALEGAAEASEAALGESVRGAAAALAASYAESYRSYEGMLGEMAALAWSALVNSVRSEGRAREDELRDAMRLLRGVLDHPVGGRNADVWLGFGWALLRSGAPLAEAEEALYHAGRLCAPGSPVRPWALRLLACVHSVQGSAAEALAEIERVVLDDAGTDILLEAAALALAAGQPERAASFATAAIDTDPSIGIDLLGNPDLSPLHEAAAEVLVRIAEDERRVARRAWARLEGVEQIAREAGRDLALDLEPLDTDLPEEIESCGLIQARRAAARLSHAADTRAGRLRDALTAIRDHAAAEATRLSRFLANAIQERDHWEASARSIEEEARAGGFALHPYTLFNPFERRKKLRAEQLRINHGQCLANYQQSVAFIASQKPRVESDIARNTQRRDRATEAIDQLDALLASPD